MYQFPPLDEEEYATLCWLSQRGYDGGLLDLLSLDREPTDPDMYGKVDGLYHFAPLSEPDAWTYNQNVTTDAEAFLSCNGSESLGKKMLDLYNKIV